MGETDHAQAAWTQQNIKEQKQMTTTTCVTRKECSEQSSRITAARKAEKSTSNSSLLTKTGSEMLALNPNDCSSDKGVMNTK
jgi:hypothetical protein